MLERVILQSSNPTILKIDDADPDDILILKSISGLTPSEVTPFIGEFARSGGYYQGRRVMNRNPVFNFKLNPGYVDRISVSDVRELLYRQFYEPGEDNDGLTVVLEDDRKPDRWFRCYADKWEGDIFASTTDVQISTMCTDPFLYSVEPTVSINEGGWLQFPFIYDGSADTGIELRLKVLHNTPTVVVENNNVKMTLEGGFVPGDIVEIGTVLGSRYIRKNGDDVMASLSSDTVGWLYLKTRENSLKVYGSEVADGRVVCTRYEYRSAWWGV